MNIMKEMETQKDKDHQGVYCERTSAMTINKSDEEKKTSTSNDE